MLGAALSGIVFATIVWMVYAIKFINASLSGISFFEAGILNVLLYVLFVCLPVLLVWIIFGFINQYVHNQSTSRQMFKLFAQMKKNQDYSDLLARIMLETEQNIKNSFVLERMELLISDMNELLSEILIRERLIGEEQAEHLWVKVKSGGKWAFGKVLIENYNAQPSFRKKIFEDAGADSLLAGTIMEFCARYQMMLGLLEKHDKERIFLNVMETGVLGKVFAVLAPISDELRRTKEVLAGEEKQQEVSERPKPQKIKIPQKQVEISVEKEEKKSFLERIVPETKAFFKKEEPEIKKDAFSLALERSFGEENTVAKIKEPVFDKAVPNEAMPAPEMKVPEVEPTETQQTLETLKKEWQNIDAASDKSSDNELTYPFGGWTDAENYQK